MYIYIGPVSVLFIHSIRKVFFSSIISDTKYGMKSDNFIYFRLTIRPVYIGDKRRKKETKDIKRKLTYS